MDRLDELATFLAILDAPCESAACPIRDRWRGAALAALAARRLPGSCRCLPVRLAVLSAPVPRQRPA
jgi:hypothetical protein